MGKAPLLERIAGDIADESRVDWKASGDATPESSGLRRLEKIASAHRDLRNTDLAADQQEATVSSPPPIVLGGAVGATAPAAESDLGESWGPLRLLARLGKGGFGEVFRAHDPALDREVALKLRRAGTRPELEEEMLEEGRRLAQVRHPNVLSVFGAAQHDGRIGLWTEIVDGVTLEQALSAQGQFAAHEAALIGVDLCRGLAAVHAAGLVHRDIKSSNAMRETGGRIVLMDFGLVSPAASGEETPNSIQGTPLYMAPEQLRGAAPKPTSDLYSLGVLLYRLVSGAYPVPGRDVLQIIESHEAGKRVPLRDVRPDLPAGFVQVIEKALDPDPDERFTSAGAMEQALLGVIGSGAPPSTDPVRAPRDRTTAYAIAALIVIAITVWAIVVVPGSNEDGTAPDGLATNKSEEGAGDRTKEARPTPMAAEFSLRTQWFRERIDTDERLMPGARVRPGDHIFLELEPSEEVHVYIITWDEKGFESMLFPHERLVTTNPIPAGKELELPGSVAGSSTPYRWEVTAAGGTEHFAILASRESIPDLDEEKLRIGQLTRGAPEAELKLRGHAREKIRDEAWKTRGVNPDPVPSREREDGDLQQILETLQENERSTDGRIFRRIYFANPEE